MRWRGLPVTDGGFSEKRRADDYIRGGFHGRRAEEAGGVFERNGIVGAGGVKRGNNPIHHEDERNGRCPCP